MRYAHNTTHDLPTFNPEHRHMDFSNFDISMALSRNNSAASHMDLPCMSRNNSLELVPDFGEQQQHHQQQETEGDHPDVVALSMTLKNTRLSANGAAAAQHAELESKGSAAAAAAAAATCLLYTSDAADE